MENGSLPPINRRPDDFSSDASGRTLSRLRTPSAPRTISLKGWGTPTRPQTDSMATSLPSAQDCETVKWHSRQKHEFIAEYLSVWTTRVGRTSKKTPPTLEIVDLFAGRGWCRADPTAEHGAPNAPWPGTAVLAARALRDYPRAKRLVLNSFNPAGTAELGKQQACLAKAVAVELGPKPPFPVVYLGKDVQAAADEAAGTVDLRYPTLWLLDPYTPEGLPWAVIERIAALKHEYADPVTGVPRTRRPELVITLITEGLQRNVDRNPGVISAALGMSETEWRPRVNELRSKGLNTRQAVVYIFSERLRGIYGNVPTVVEVPGSAGNIVYVLVFCSPHSAGAYMARMRVKPEFEKWQIESWRPLAKLISKNRAIRRAGGKDAPVQRSLDNFPVEQ